MRFVEFSVREEVHVLGVDQFNVSTITLLNSLSSHFEICSLLNSMCFLTCMLSFGMFCC